MHLRLKKRDVYPSETSLLSGWLPSEAGEAGEQMAKGLPQNDVGFGVNISVSESWAIHHRLCHPTFTPLIYEPGTTTSSPWGQGQLRRKSAESTPPSWPSVSAHCFSSALLQSLSPQTYSTVKNYTMYYLTCSSPLLRKICSKRSYRPKQQTCL